MGGWRFPLPVTAALTAVGGGERDGSGGELGYGEGHGAEEIAGVVRASRYAFLVGDDEISGGNEILSGANQTNQREDAEGNHEDTPVVILATVTALAADLMASVTSAERPREAACNGVGYVAGATAAANRLVAKGLQYLHTQHDRLYDLYYRCGDVPFLVAGLRLGAEGRPVGAGAEYAHRGVPTEQHHLLFQHGDTVKFGGLSTAAVTAADAGLKDELDVEADVDGVESPIELDGIQPNIGPGNAGVLHPYLSGAVNDLFPKIREEYPHVLKAVPITAGVQNAVGLHANGTGVPALATTICGGTAGNETIFRHNVYLHMD